MGGIILSVVTLLIQLYCGAPSRSAVDLCFLFFASQQKFACNGTVVEHSEHGEVIQLQGDQRKNIRQFLIDVSH